MNLIQDDVNKLFYQFLVPVISSSVAVATYSLVDTIAIGQGVGPAGTAACALVLPIFSIANFIALLCGIGGSVLMSRARGEGKREKGDAYFAAAIVLIIALTILVWLPGNLFQEAFYTMCGADAYLMPYAKAYGAWIFAFLPSFVITAFLNCFVRTDGSPRFAMCTTLTGGIVNIIGDWVFVFPLKMGMAGAAIATVMGSMVQALLLIGYILLKKSTLNLSKPHAWKTAFRKITATGVSAGVGALAVILVSFIANNQIMHYEGSAALAVYGVLGTVSALFTSIFSGIGQAAQPIVSENYGAGNIKRCWKAAVLGLKSAILFGITFATISIIFPIEVAGLFMKMTPAVEAVAPYIIRVFSLSYIPQAVCVFCVYYLQSVVCHQMATVVSMLRGMILNGILLLCFPFIWGGKGIWWAFVIAEFLTMTIACIYMSKTYRRHHDEL